MTPHPWFRFYSETLSDRKIEYLCRTTEHPKALIIGVWATVMALANDSPVRGVLLLTEDIALTLEDLERETGLELDILESLIAEFDRLEMLRRIDGAYCLLNWDKRQFASDSSSERVRRWREKQRDEPDEPDETADFEEDGEVTETLQGSYGNGPETESETESEQNTLSRGEKSPSRSPPRRGYTEGQKKFLGLFGAKRFKTPAQADAVLRLEQTYGTNKLVELAEWAAKKGMTVGGGVVAVESALGKGNAKDGIIEVSPL